MLLDFLMIFLVAFASLVSAGFTVVVAIYIVFPLLEIAAGIRLAWIRKGNTELNYYARRHSIATGWLAPVCIVIVIVTIGGYAYLAYQWLSLRRMIIATTFLLLGAVIGGMNTYDSIEERWSISRLFKSKPGTTTTGHLIDRRRD